MTIPTTTPTQAITRKFDSAVAVREFDCDLLVHEMLTLLFRHRSIILHRGHSYHIVIPLFVIALRNAQDHKVFLHSKMCGLAYGQKRRMFFVARTYVIDQLFRLQHVLMAKGLAGLAMSAV